MTTKPLWTVELEIQGKPVPISTDNLDSLVFKLPEPIVLGSWNDFTEYLKREWSVDVPKPQDTGVPALDNAYRQLTENAELMIKTLTVDQKQRTYEIGIAIEFKDGVVLLPGVKFKGVGVAVKIERESFLLEKPLGKDATELALPDAVAEKWKNAQKIRVENETIGAAVKDHTMTLTRDSDNKAEHPAKAVVMLWEEKTA